ncbi:MAG: type IV pilus biogenesis protein PilM [Bacillota bacterium]
MLLRRRAAGIGLDIEDNRARMVALIAERSALRLEGYGEATIPAEALDNGRMNRPEIMAEVLRELWFSLKTRESRIVTAVPNQHVFVRNLSLPAMRPRDVFKVARHHFLSVLPLPLEETVIQVSGIRPRETGDLETTLVAVRRSQIEDLVTAISLAGLKPVVVEIRPLAARRVLGIDTTPQILVDIGSQAVHLSYFDKGQLRFARTLFPGETGEQKDAGIDFRTASDGGKCPNTPDLAFEIKRSLDYWSREIEGELGLRKLVVIGTNAGADSLIQTGDHSWPIDVEWGDPWRTVQASDSQTSIEKHNLGLRLAVALGLAARGGKSR